MVHLYITIPEDCRANNQPLDPQVTQAEDSPQLISALKAHAAVRREQKLTLAHVLEGFVHTLCASSDVARRVIAADSWDGHTNWGDEEWVAWRTWMWYKHFCRVVRATIFLVFDDGPLMCFPSVLAVPPRFCDYAYRCLLCLVGDFR
jgi:hypothetical protein